MPSFQSPVPKSGSPCAPAVRPLSIARTQCSKIVSTSGEMPGRPVRFVLAARKERCRQERHALVEERRISCCAHVLGNRERKPEQVVGAAASKTPAGRRVPPVLYVTLNELPARGAHQMFARQVRPGKRERHDVLQLIAESVRAAWLEVPGASPEAAADVLIDEPSIHQDVERIVRRAHANRIERAVPGRPNHLERLAGARHCSMLRDEPALCERDRRPPPAGRRSVSSRPDRERFAPASPHTHRARRRTRRSGRRCESRRDSPAYRCVR